MNRLFTGYKSKRKFGIFLFVTLIAAGLAGNYFNFPIFLNIAFLFGSIFAMLALQLFGLGQGVFAAALIASYTYFIWNHPYAIVTMTAEVAVVGLLMERKKIGLVLADALYWLVIGMPLVFIFYHIVMHSPLETTYINMIKQTVNGIFNALLARLIFTGITLYYRFAKVSFREIIYNLLAIFVLCPALIVFAVSSRSDFAEYDLTIRASLVQNKLVLTKKLNEWVIDNKLVVNHLAEMAVSRTPSQMLPYLELATRSNVNFQRIGLFNQEAVSTAYFPMFDEVNHQSNIGRDFSYRTYISSLKQKRQPMSSEVMVSQIGKQGPIVGMLAPVFIHGKYSGYISGILLLDEMREYLELTTENNFMRYTLLDKSGNIIITNHADQKAMSPFVREQGTFEHIDADIDLWLPEAHANTPISDRFKKSVYIAESSIGDMSEWKLILEQPLAHIQNQLYLKYTGRLMLLFVILIVALLLAELLSRQIVATLTMLGTLTHALPNRLTNNVSVFNWPETGMAETNHLIENFKEMTGSLSSQFAQVRHLNESLEQRVDERTLELVNSEKRLLAILNVSPIAIRITNKVGREVVFCNQGYANLFKNIDVLSSDPNDFYVRVDDYEKVLAELAQGKSILSHQIELKTSMHSTVWTLASYMPIQYQGVDSVLGWFYDISNIKAAEEQIRQLAFHDPLTNLPNRLLLVDRLKQALAVSARSNRRGAMFFIDLDNFKNLNDTLGHDTGDVLLQQVAQRLTVCIREGDTVARLGGDEFVVMLLDLSEHPLEAAEQAKVICEEILVALSQTYRLEKNIFRCTASIGITLFKGNKQSPDELMKQADIAMYQAKKAGRNTLQFFDNQMQENITSRVSLEGELHNALELNQLHLYYQIQVDSLNRPLGAEALIRWIHPERGMISPYHFIPLAEEIGLILPIGLWVLETACKQLKAWQQDVATSNLVLAVNVSAKQFHQGDFVHQVQTAVQRNGINPSLLKLELTESMLQDSIDETLLVMNTLKQIGVTFSLDDFGTGYSSLQYLKRLPLDQLKIDQSFVRDIANDSSDKAIVRTIIVMAQNLSMNVIAEGVETEDQRHFLMDNGCSNYQGYLFGRPMPIDEFDAQFIRLAIKNHH